MRWLGRAGSYRSRTPALCIGKPEKKLIHPSQFWDGLPYY